MQAANSERQSSERAMSDVKLLIADYHNSKMVKQAANSESQSSERAE